MGQALKRPGQIAIDRRPSKILRQRNIQLVNLGTYSQSTPSRAAVSHPKQPNASSTTHHKTRSEHVKLGSQPFNAKTATNDTTFEQSVSQSKQPFASPKSPLTIIILSSLCIGSLVGYQWSSLLNLAPEASNKAESELVIDIAATETLGPTDTNATFAVPVVSRTQAQTEAGIEREQQYRLKEKELLSQIDLLGNQNSVLVNELDALKTETFDQNSELLALELEFVALQSQSKRSTETRVIYNFVNTPVGSSAPVQFSGTSAQYDEDALEDSDEELAYKLEEQRAQYNEEGQLVYDLETRKYTKNFSEGYVELDEQGNPEEANYEDSTNVDSTNYTGDELESYETVNSELINELQQVQLRQFEAGLLDYDHTTGTFVQKDFSSTNN